MAFNIEMDCRNSEELAIQAGKTEGAISVYVCKVPLLVAQQVFLPLKPRLLVEPLTYMLG